MNVVLPLRAHARRMLWTPICQSKNSTAHQCCQKKMILLLSRK